MRCNNSKLLYYFSTPVRYIQTIIQHYEHSILQGRYTLEQLQSLEKYFHQINTASLFQLHLSVCCMLLVSCLLFYLISFDEITAGWSAKNSLILVNLCGGSFLCTYCFLYEMQCLISCIQFSKMKRIVILIVGSLAPPSFIIILGIATDCFPLPFLVIISGAICSTSFFTVVFSIIPKSIRTHLMQTKELVYFFNLATIQFAFVILYNLYSTFYGRLEGFNSMGFVISLLTFRMVVNRINYRFLKKCTNSSITRQNFVVLIIFFSEIINYIYTATCIQFSVKFFSVLQIIFVDFIFTAKQLWSLRQAVQISLHMRMRILKLQKKSTYVKPVFNQFDRIILDVFNEFKSVVSQQESLYPPNMNDHFYTKTHPISAREPIVSQCISKPSSLKGISSVITTNGDLQHSNEVTPLTRSSKADSQDVHQRFRGLSSLIELSSAIPTSFSLQHSSSVTSLISTAASQDSRDSVEENISLHVVSTDMVSTSAVLPFSSSCEQNSIESSENYIEIPSGISQKIEKHVGEIRQTAIDTKIPDPTLVIVKPCPLKQTWNRVQSLARATNKITPSTSIMNENKEFYINRLKKWKTRGNRSLPNIKVMNNEATNGIFHYTKSISKLVRNGSMALVKQVTMVRLHDSKHSSSLKKRRPFFYFLKQRNPANSKFNLQFNSRIESLHEEKDEMTSRMIYAQQYLHILLRTEYFGLLKYIQMLLPLVYYITLELRMYFPLDHSIPFSQQLVQDVELKHNLRQNFTFYIFAEILFGIVIWNIGAYYTNYSIFQQVSMTVSKHRNILIAMCCLWMVTAAAFKIPHFGTDLTLKKVCLQQSKS